MKKVHARTAPSERRKIAESVAFAIGDGKPRWNDNRNAPFWKERARKAKKRLETDEGNG